MSAYSTIKSIDAKKKQNELIAQKLAGNLEIAEEENKQKKERLKKQLEENKKVLASNILNQENDLLKKGKENFIKTSFENKAIKESVDNGGLGQAIEEKYEALNSQKSNLSNAKNKSDFDNNIKKIKADDEKSTFAVEEKIKSADDLYSQKIAKIALDIEKVNKTLENLEKERAVAVEEKIKEDEALKIKEQQARQNQIQKAQNTQKNAANNTNSSTASKNKTDNITKLNMSIAAKKVKNFIDDNIIIKFEGKKSESQMKNLIKQKILGYCDSGVINEDEAAVLIKIYGAN